MEVPGPALLGAPELVVAGGSSGASCARSSDPIITSHAGSAIAAAGFAVSRGCQTRRASRADKSRPVKPLSAHTARRARSGGIRVSSWTGGTGGGHLRRERAHGTGSAKIAVRVITNGANDTRADGGAAS